MKFKIDGVIRLKKSGYRRAVTFYIEGDDREDARFQVHHGVIEANVSKKYPDATASYNLRTLRRCC